MHLPDSKDFHGKRRLARKQIPANYRGNDALLIFPVPSLHETPKNLTIAVSLAKYYHKKLKCLPSSSF